MTQRRREILALPHPNGGALRATLSYNHAGSPVALAYVHGFGSRRSGQKALALEEMCAERRWTFFAADFRGHGESTGSMLDIRGRGLQADLDVLATFLQDRGVSQLFLVGSSMGGWASAWFALRRCDLVKGCVLVAPALNFVRGKWDRLGEEEKETWRRTGKRRVRNQWLNVEIGFGLVEEMDDFPLERLEREWSTPALIVHGLRDQEIAYTDSISFLERTACDKVELWLIREANHRLQGYEKPLARAACDFCERCQKEA